ncbi:MAG: hypothetical protein M3Y54_12895 [Bacteroidota bacterium]|nr:hypothetical protein [Bacteroidota bacterium]
MSLLRQSLPWGLSLMVFLWVITAVFDGLTSSTSHFDTYYGSLSWQQYRVTFRPIGTGRQPAPTGFASTLRYGFNLADHAALRANLLQTDVPPAEVAPLLYNTLRYPRGFSSDSVYAAWVGVRGHFLTYAFGARPAAVVRSYQAVAAPATPPHYPPQPRLLWPLRLYAWVSLLLMGWLGAAIMALMLLADFRDAGSRLATLGLILAYAASQGYVDWLDYQTGQESPIFGPLGILLLLLAYGYILRLPASNDEAASTDGPAAGHCPTPNTPPRA